MELYLVEFKVDATIEAKNYFSDFKVENDKYQLIIVITYDEYIFLSNIDIYKSWIWISNTVLWLKDCR